MSNADALQAWAAEILPIVQAIVDGHEVEFRFKEFSLIEPGWMPKEEPGFSPIAEYRVKDATREINGFTVPAPYLIAPKAGVTYYYPRLTAMELVSKCAWNAGSIDLQLLRLGLVFKTKMAAQQNALAMLGISPDTPLDKVFVD